MPDTYRELAHALNESLEDALMGIESYDEMMRIREWADRELRPRLRALDEAGPYGWAEEERVDGEWCIVDWHEDHDEAVRSVRWSYRYEHRLPAHMRLRPLYAGTPEEVEGE